MSGRRVKERLSRVSAGWMRDRRAEFVRDESVYKEPVVMQRESSSGFLLLSVNNKKDTLALYPAAPIGGFTNNPPPPIT